MGFFSDLFSSHPKYPPLDLNSHSAQLLEEVKPQLKELAGKVSDPLEVIPSEHAAYVFIGKPPKSFGLAWVHDGEVSGLNTLIEEHGMKPDEIAHVVDELREAYKHCDRAERYSAELEGTKLVVTPSDQLEHEVHDIIDKLTH
ncbi:hypothetical protein [Motiliproteus sediminis]|uniref:hypothetical protein n=1 Tax=Motiliproteus sediminis TaxID=1468178 RepID=UPI001AEFCBA5|nr:hypothetical protein [Motiliproteus sediminis]